MRRKSKYKEAIKRALKVYYEKGLTQTAYTFQKRFERIINRFNKPRT